jgi:DNA-binding GntR family transcriptional regulator
MNEEEFLPYDDDEAIKFIRNQIPQELKEKFSDDDLNYLIDLIYEFYEDKGFLNDDDTEVDIDLDELTAYVVKQSKKDKVGVYTEEEVSFVVDAEIAYCDSLGVFE